MTQKILDALIKKIIIPQSKPRSTRNSFFRKPGDKRRLSRLIKIKKFLPHCYDYVNGARVSCRYSFCIYGYKYCCGINFRALVGRFKTFSNFDAKTRKCIKRLQCRTPRRFKNDIANGSEYKRLHMKNAH